MSIHSWHGIASISTRKRLLPFTTRTIFLLCGIVLWLSGAFLMLFTTEASGKYTASHITNKGRPGVTTPIQQTHTPPPVQTIYSGSASLSTTTPTPTATASPTPITPFPGTKAQEVAALQANDRFLYHGNNLLPEIALTFDDGPNPPYTPQILDILDRYNIKASFFTMGLHASQYPGLVKREFLEGHTVGNHTWSHPSLPALSPDSIIWQLTTSASTLKNITGVYPTFFRPPYGNFDAKTLACANQFGLSTILWNDDPMDWSLPGVNTIVNRALSEATPGGIILMHDGGGYRRQTVLALPLLIEGLQARGYHFVTIQQLVAHMHAPIVDPTHADITPPVPTQAADIRRSQRRP